MDGHAFEYWCADLLRKNGFSNVSVTQGSGDQGVDVLAEKGGVKYAIQCKCYTNDLGNKPVQEVHAGKDIYHCHVGVVMTNSHFTPGAVQAAEGTHVLLWDRETLKAMIDASGVSGSEAIPVASGTKTHNADIQMQSNIERLQRLKEAFEPDIPSLWHQNALKKAQEYLSSEAHSKESLIEQLEHDGFTHEQAVYAVEHIE